MKLRSTSTAPAVTVLAPGLLGPWPRALHREVTAGLELPALARLLARARTRPSPFPPGPEGAPGGEEAPSLEAILASAVLGLRGGEDEVPAGPLSLRAEGQGSTGTEGEGEGGGWVLRVEPLHVVADLRGARVWRGAELGIEADEARALLARLNAGCHSPPGRLVMGSSPERWYLECPAPPEVRLAPIGRILAEGPGVHPPRGPDAPAWQRWLTEVQMLLHDAPENLRRMAAGRPVVNALWPWGGGPRTGSPAAGTGVAPWDHVWSAEPFVRGGALVAGAQAGVLPPDGEAWGQSLPPGESLVVWEEAWLPCATRSVEDWRSRLEQFEQRWAVPLAALLEEGRLARLVLDPALRPGDPRHVLVPSRLRRPLLGRLRPARLRGAGPGLAPWLFPEEGPGEGEGGRGLSLPTGPSGRG